MISSVKSRRKKGGEEEANPVRNYRISIASIRKSFQFHEARLVSSFNISFVDTSS